MKRISLAFTMMMAAMVAAQAQTPTNSIGRPWAAGGRFEMKLAAGDYEIRPGADDRVLVTWTGGDDAKADLKVTLTATEKLGKLVIKNTPHSNFHVRIELPQTCDVRVRLSAGNLEFGSIKGSKDIESHAGNLDLSVGNPSDYAKVNASVRVGDLVSSAFDISKAGFFRRFNWAGPGTYKLHVHVGAGNINLNW